MGRDVAAIIALQTRTQLPASGHERSSDTDLSSHTLEGGLEVEILEKLSGSAIKMPTSPLCVTPARCHAAEGDGAEKLLGGREDKPHFF